MFLCASYTLLTTIDNYLILIRIKLSDKINKTLRRDYM